MLVPEQNTILKTRPTVSYPSGTPFGYNLLTKNKPSITEDGKLLVFVGTDNNIYLYVDSSLEKYQITTDGKWHNVAISRKGDYIAAIPDPTYEPSKIYILNTNTAAVEAKTLYIPNTSENSAPSYAYYADIVDFSIGDEYLIYDCYSIKTLQSGALLDTWEIMLMRRSDGSIVSVFPPQADGIMVGNPSFANTKKYLFAFDLMDARVPTIPNYYISTYNMFTGELGLIFTGNGIGFPAFSPNDKKAVYQIYGADGITPNLYQIEMTADGMNGVDSKRVYFGGSICYPEWYATGSRPVSVEKTEETKPRNYELMNSYPNPFNSTATIKILSAENDEYQN